MFGNILEWYDFALYGFLAIIIAQLFFPPDGLTPLLSTFAVFAVGFLMRPIGAWLFGYIGDRFSRPLALKLSVVLMGVATLLLGLLPTYAAIGIGAPILLIILRMLQGLSVGGEFSTSVTYLVEHAPPTKRGVFGSIANVGSMGGMLLGVSVAAATTSFFSPDTLLTWGWRLPFLLGGVLGLIALILRSHMPTHVLEKHQQRHSAKTPFREAVTNNRRELLEALFFSLGYAVLFYITFVYLPTYVNEFFQLPLDTALQMNTISIALIIFLIPGFGYLSDILPNRRTILLYTFGLTGLMMVPLFMFLGMGELWQFFVVQSLLGVLMAVALGIAPALYVELFPKSDRLTAYSITFNVSLGIFGGTTPLIATWLIHMSGNLLAPAYYTVGALLCAVGALFYMRREPVANV